MRALALCSALLTLTSAAVRAEPERVRTVAVSPALGEGTPTERAALQAQLHTAIERLEGFTLLDPDLAAQELEGAEALGLQCGAADDACLGRLAVTLPADLLVAPTVEGAGQSARFSLAAYDSVTSGKLNQVEGPLAPIGPQRIAQINGMVELLLAPERAFASLRVKTDLAARVTLDERAPQTGRQALFEDLVPGEHRLIVEAGERRVEKQVELQAGEDKALDVALDPEAPPAPGVPPGGLSWWTLGGGAAAALGAGLAVVGAGAALAGAAGVVFLVEPALREGGRWAALAGLAALPVGVLMATGGVAALGAGILLE